MNITDFAEQFADKMEEIKAFVEGDDIKDITRYRGGQSL